MSKSLYLALGHVAVALGAVGIFLPLLPTTPFLLLAAYCYSHGSPRFHFWLTHHQTFGPLIRSWQERGAISSLHKGLALVLMGAGLAIAYYLLAPPTWLLGIMFGVLAAVALFIVSRPSPR